MKKIFILLVTLIMMSAYVFADGLTATLQQGIRMTPFYGDDAFKNAYAAADSGAVITLSEETIVQIQEIMIHHQTMAAIVVHLQIPLQRLCKRGHAVHVKEQEKL